MTDTLVFMTHHPELQGAPIVVELDHETLIWFSTLKENPAMRNSSLQPQQLECTLQIQSASLNEMLSLPSQVTFPAVLLVEYTEQIWLHLTFKDPTTLELYPCHPLELRADGQVHYPEDQDIPF